MERQLIAVYSRHLILFSGRPRGRVGLTAIPTPEQQEIADRFVEKALGELNGIQLPQMRIIESHVYGKLFMESNTVVAVCNDRDDLGIVNFQGVNYELKSRLAAPDKYELEVWTDNEYVAGSISSQDGDYDDLFSNISIRK